MTLDVLFVEGEQVALTRLEAVLGGAGHRVAAATDGRQGLQQLARRNFDVVIADVQIGVDGTSLFRAARQLHPGVDIILMAREGNVDEAVTTMREGAFDYLTKPLSPAQLLAALSRLEKKLLRHRDVESGCGGYLRRDLERPRASMERTAGTTQVRPLAESIRDVERRCLLQALGAAKGARKQAADLLGISRKTLWEKLKVHRITESDLERAILVRHNEPMERATDYRA